MFCLNARRTISFYSQTVAFAHWLLESSFFLSSYAFEPCSSAVKPTPTLPSISYSTSTLPAERISSTFSSTGLGHLCHDTFRTRALDLSISLCLYFAPQPCVRPLRSPAVLSVHDTLIYYTPFSPTLAPSHTAFQVWWAEMPKITKTLFAGSFLFTLAAHFGLLSPWSLILDWQMIWYVTLKASTF